MRKGQHALVVGIAGGSGSGKSTLARLICEHLVPGQALCLAEDAYYKDQGHLPPLAREKINYDHPGTIDLAMLSCHVAQLRSLQPVLIPRYDFATHTRNEDGEWIIPSPVTVLVIVEGLHVLSTPSLRRLYDFSIYIDHPFVLRLMRRLRRDCKERDRTRASVLRQCLLTVQPMHLMHVAASRRYADLVIAGDAHSLARASAHIEELIKDDINANRSIFLGATRQDAPELSRRLTDDNTSLRQGPSRA
jgi:uridine kinase